MSQLKQGNYRLGENDVAEMRKLHRKDRWTIRQIARKFNVRRSTASEAINGTYHKDVKTMYDLIPNPPNPGNSKISDKQREWVKSRPADLSSYKIRAAMIEKYGTDRALSARQIREIRRRVRNEKKRKTGTD